MNRLLPVFLLIASISTAHDELAEQVQTITATIKEDPNRADLYFQRAEMYRADSHWAEAERDYLRAKRLDPGLETIDLGLGLLYSTTKRFAEAKSSLDKFLLKHPDHAPAHVARGRILSEMLKLQAAVEDYTHALRVRPDPEIYIERAHILTALNKREEALAGLNEGIERLGSVVTLELAAIDLDVHLGRYDDALIRIDRIALQSDRKDMWLVRRAEILREASRTTEARQTYLNALKAIESLPDARRSTKYTQDLQRRIQVALKQLDTNSTQ